MKTGSLEDELGSNGASPTQNCLENTTARILEYRTNVNGTVKWFFREYFETIGRVVIGMKLGPFASMEDLQVW